MPLILVPLGIILLAAFALSTAIAAVEAERARSEAERGVLAKVLIGIFAPLSAGGWDPVASVQKKISSVVSRFAGAKLAALAGWLAGLGTLAHELEVTLYSFAATTADAISHIATVTLPHEVAAATRPVGRTARQALRQARRGYTAAQLAARAARAARAAAEAGLTRVRHRLGELDASLRWARNRIRTLTDRVGRIAGRLSKVEKAVTFAALAGVVVKVLARRFPWLFCRRTNLLGKRVCGLDADYLESLLGTALLVASALSLAEMARALRGPTNLVAENLPKLIRELPGGG